MKRLVLFGLILMCTDLRAQDQDSVQILEFDRFYGYVIANHPIVKQAMLLTSDAAQQLRLARGSFDPKLEGSWNLKNFKDTEYFNMGEVSLKIPTWFPVNPKIGIERNRGTYLNRENFIADDTNNRQVFAGVSIPIGQGLFIDQRRALVKQAQIFQDIAEAEQIKEINKVLLTATKDYWQWYFAYKNYDLIRQSINIAQDIYDRTRLGFEYGENAAIDTVQARIALQSRRIEFEQANIERIKAALSLSNHLWTQDGKPLEIPDYVKPEDHQTAVLDNEILGQLVKMARQNHPELLKLKFKNETLIIDKSLAKENLKPKLDLDYTLLDQPLSPAGGNLSLIHI